MRLEAGMPIRKHLTKATVDAQVPRRREFIVWDDQIPRFGLRVRPTGGKAYVLRLRVDGRQRWYTIGAHGDPWTPDTARDEADRVLGQAANVRKLRETGAAPANLRHPIEAREYRRDTPTLAEFAKRYMEEYARPHKRASSVAADAANLRRSIVPVLGKLRLDAITQSEVTRFHLSLKDTPTGANRCLSLLSHMMSMAEAWGLRARGSNPCLGVRRFPETKRERFLSGAELARLGAAIGRMEKAQKVTPFGLAAVRLLIFTGARASEILGLQWDAVNVKARVVHLAQSKTGPKPLYLNPPAAMVLSRLARIRGNPNVIVGGRKDAALTLSGLEQVWQEVRKVARLDDVRLHDLRHSFASVAVAGGASLPILGKLLGHTQAATTQRYAHLAADPLRQASEAIGNRINSAMRGGKAAEPPPDLSAARRRRGAAK
jgi:integrase